MRNITVCAVLAGAVASTVSAAPKDDEITERVGFEAAGEGARDWVELASETPTTHGREFITLDENKLFAQLRIDAVRGRPRVRAVQISYRDGTERLVRVDRVLGTTHRHSAYVDLGGPRRIEHVVVITDPRSGGSFTVHGSRTPMRDVAAN